jgi:hypothetical protein
MSPRHVTSLLSAAYDGALTPAERRRYDEHVAACPECAAEAERFRQAIDAIHALPVARMPQRVVLPSTPPQPERRRWSPPLPAWMPRPQLTPAWSAGTMIAAGLVAVIVVVHANLGGAQPSATGAIAKPNALGAARGQQGALGGDAGASRKSVTTGIGTCPLPLAVVPQPDAAPSPPPGFENVVVAGDPKRPGQSLVLATATTRFAPGSKVLIYAALVSGTGQHVAVVPCVTLHPQGAVAYAPGAGSGGSPAAGTTSGSSASATPCSTCGSAAGGAGPAAAAAPGPAYASSLGTLLSPDQVRAFAPYPLLPPLAVASPTAAAVSNLPLQVIEIPSGLPPGTHLEFEALVPSGLPSSSDSPALQAVLTFDVS